MGNVFGLSGRSVKRIARTVQRVERSSVRQPQKRDLHRSRRGVGTHGVFAVTISQAGGTNGDATSPATWTYHVWPLGGDIEDAGSRLASDVALARPRSNGHLIPPEPGGTGLAFRDENGDIALWDAGEIFQTELCEVNDEE